MDSELFADSTVDVDNEVLDSEDDLGDEVMEDDGVDDEDIIEVGAVVVLVTVAIFFLIRVSKCLARKFLS